MSKTLDTTGKKFMRETDARILIDRRLRESDWDIENKNQVSTEETSQNGRADYILKDSRGRAIAVIEAKRFSVDPASAKELIEKYRDELKELCKYDNDTKDVFGFVNSWWVFGEVAKELNYKIFMAEVENVGYKRTKRGEKPMPNELYRVNDKGEVLVNDGVTKTALDYMRKIDWE